MPNNSQSDNLLTLKCATKAGAERLYTLNFPEFTRLAPEEIRNKLATVLTG